MKYFLPLVLLFSASLLLITACDDDDDTATQTGTVDITFASLYNAANLSIQDTGYDYPDGSKLKVQLFQYYISDLELLPADGGNPVRLTDIELLKYGTAGGSHTQSLTFTDVPAGEYSGIRFGLGVKEELNNQPPSNFAANFVLNEAEYWNDNVRYVFAKIEANVDLNDNGMFDTPVSYHMGNNSIFTTLTFNGNFSVAENTTQEMTFAADVYDALVADENTFHDFSDPDQRIVHGGNQAISADIWNRLANAFTLSIPQ
ncbi:MAG: MbnP family protein [Bacteroidota bacterium]